MHGMASNDSCKERKEMCREGSFAFHNNGFGLTSPQNWFAIHQIHINKSSLTGWGQGCKSDLTGS